MARGQVPLEAAVARIQALKQALRSPLWARIAGKFGHNVRMAHAFRRGDHICSIHDSEEEQLATAAAYIADGIGRGERGLYVGVSEDAVLRFRAALGAIGLDPAALCGRGALILVTPEQAYLAGGYFELERMLELIDQAIDQAVNDGFSGLRGCGDMSWLLAGAPGSEQAVSYEAVLGQFLSGRRACAMCQYNRQRLPLPMIDMALATHSTAVIAGKQKFNPFFQAGRDATPAG